MREVVRYGRRYLYRYFELTECLLEKLLMDRLEKLEKLGLSRCHVCFWKVVVSNAIDHWRKFWELYHHFCQEIH